MAESKRLRVVHEAPSPFGTIYVVDEGDQRSLRFNSIEGTLQSAFLKSDPLAVTTNYVRLAATGLALTRGRRRVLVVGLGGGSFPRLLHRRLPHVRVDVVELNPVVVDVAQRFFGVHEDSRLRIHVDDAADYIHRREPPYDLIFLDAFTDGGTPEHLKETLFLEAVRGRLAPGGVVVLNVALERPLAVEARIASFAHVFPGCAVLRGSPETGNRILLGSRLPVPAEPVFRKRLHPLARELELPRLDQSVTSFSRVPA
jgi:spermidine synthase